MPAFFSLFTPQVRQYLYTVASALLALLVAIHVINPAIVPAWLALAGAVLSFSATTVATIALRAQRRDGTIAR